MANLKNTEHTTTHTQSVVLSKITFVALLFFAFICPQYNAFAKINKFRKFENYCNLVHQEKILAKVELRQGATDVEKDAANFLTKSLGKLCANATILSPQDKSQTGNFIRVKLNLKKDLSDKNHFRREKIFISVSRNEIEIAYSAVHDVWTAVGIFLDEYCNAKFFAPLPLGEEIAKHKNLRIPCGTREIVLPFIERAMFSYYKKAKEFELINGQTRPFWFNCHNLPLLLKQETRDNNPDWFALCNGKRGTSNFAQLDFLNKDARDYVSKLSRDFFEKNSTSKILSLCFSDNGKFDTTSKTLSHVRGFNHRGYNDYSNIIFDFTNDIAKSVAKKYPEKLVAQLAYLRTETPPDFKLEKNVSITLCTDKSNWYINSEREIDKKLIQDWSTSGAGLLGIHDYNYGLGHWLPREVSEYIAESIKLYHNANFKSYVAESYPIWAYDIFKIWVTSKLLKNPKLEYESLKSQFFEEYYKESSKHVRKFFEIAENSWKNRNDSPALWLKLFKRPSQLEILSQADLQNMQDALLNAEKSARSKIVSDRIKEIRLVFDMTQTAHRIYFYTKNLWNSDVSKSNANYIINTIEALKVARALNDIQLKKQRFESKYPKSNFTSWELIDMFDPTEMKARELLSLNDPKISDEIERILGKEFCKNAKSLCNGQSQNLLKNPSFENGLTHWTVSRSVTCKETCKANSKAARTGKYGVQLSSIDYIALSQKIPVKANGDYVFRCYGKGKIDIGATYYMRLTFFLNKNVGAKNPVYYLQIPMGNFCDFKKFEISAKAPEGVQFAECVFFSVNASDQYPISLDDFSFVEAR